MNKKVGFILVVPILVSMLSWFFYQLNLSYKSKESSGNNSLAYNNSPNWELEEYIIGVVSCEMPALYQEEALKAQAIAARTYAAYKITKEGATIESLKRGQEQCYYDPTEQQDKWQEDYSLYSAKIANIVDQTKQLVMKKDNELFKSFYFSTSNGQTENSEVVFGVNSLPSVASPWDKENPNYEVQTLKSFAEMTELFGSNFDLSIMERNETNHVEKVIIADHEYTGIEIRKLLNLRSTDFDIVKTDENYIITTRGYGHGVGMSQYGANELAKEGKSAEEILNYYYSGVEILKMDV